MTPPRPLLELDGITKRFGDLVANDSVSLSVAAGEVVAMLGENGAGKSTLMKIVYGLVRPDAGAISMDGRALDIGSPRDAMAAGIGMVTQEFSLVETMTVTENVALSSVGFGRVDVRAARQRVMDAMDRVGVHIEPERLVSTLSIGERQRVEIVKALFHECRVLILDEPTAVLTPQDVRALFATIDRLRGTGLGVLFVSHKLREVAEISDRVVVLRRGRLVGERVTAEVTTKELAGLMMGTASAPEEEVAAAVGLPVEEEPVAAGSASGGTTERPPVLRMTEVTLEHQGRPVLDRVSLDVMPGEIVGLAGISGNGQTELMSVLAGTESPTGGRIEVDGADVTRLDIAGRLEAGLGRLTEDRRGSVVPQMSVEHNLVLEDLRSFTRRGTLDRAAIREARGAADRALRHPGHADRPGRHPLGRQHAEGPAGQSARAPAPGAHRGAADARSRHRRLPVRPRTAPRAPRRGSRCPRDLGGSRRAAQPLRPDPGALPRRRHRQRCRGRRDQRPARRDDDR